jgi:hypothetical protein
MVTPVRLDRCPSCEGRGWKLISSRRVVMVAEDVVHVGRLPCMECNGRATRRAA